HSLQPPFPTRRSSDLRPSRGTAPVRVLIIRAARSQQERAGGGHHHPACAPACPPHRSGSHQTVHSILVRRGRHCTVCPSTTQAPDRKSTRLNSSHVSI